MKLIRCSVCGSWV